MPPATKIRAGGPLKSALSDVDVRTTFGRYLRQLHSVVHSARLAGPFKHSRKIREQNLQQSKARAAVLLGGFLAALRTYYAQDAAVAGPWSVRCEGGLWWVVREGRFPLSFTEEGEAITVAAALNRHALHLSPTMRV